MRSIPYLAIAAVVMAAIIGCGGDDAPSSVSESDLREGAEFWSSLDDELRRELADICHSKQVAEASVPAEVQVIQDFDTDDYVAFIDDYYEEDGGEADIDGACEEAKVALASQNFGELSPQLSP